MNNLEPPWGQPHGTPGFATSPENLLTALGTDVVKLIDEIEGVVK